MKKNFKLVTFLLLVFITIFAVSGIVIAKEDTEDIVEEIAYIEITVHEGDTLWNIAKPYYDGKSDYRKFIYEIRELNNLEQGVIYPGQIIIIPET